ncbi:Uncharacterised protein [Brucella neotomae]|nr:hypothetical protein DK64_1080 [Brucella neotomae 5K33]SPU67901.1 Uncharacterised protein [Brucella neotomae]SPU69291.1 Uncharacterised protein [Brucella neotomae]SUW39121.1 Uncharacterised protein [Brucella neotomae]
MGYTWTKPARSRYGQRRAGKIKISAGKRKRPRGRRMRGLILNTAWEEECRIPYRVLGGGELDVCISIRRPVSQQRPIMHNSYANRPSLEKSIKRRQNASFGIAKLVDFLNLPFETGFISGGHQTSNSTHRTTMTTRFQRKWAISGAASTLTRPTSTMTSPAMEPSSLPIWCALATPAPARPYRKAHRAPVPSEQEASAA